MQGIYYEPGKEPPSEGPPKLHLLIESNEEIRVRKPVFLIFQDRIHQSFMHRLSKQCGRSRGCSSKPLLRPCKRRCGIPLAQWVDIVCCSLLISYCVSSLYRQIIQWYFSLHDGTKDQRVTLFVTCSDQTLWISIHLQAEHGPTP